MKIKLLLFLSVIGVTVYLLGCEIQQASYPDTGIGGLLLDSATRLPILNAQITIDPPGITVNSDTSGQFYIGHIPVGTSAGNFWLTITKPGYDTLKVFAILYSNDTTKRFNLIMFQDSREVYVNYNAFVIEFVNSLSMSSVNLFDILTIQDTNLFYRDMRLRDSAATRNNYSFLTGYDHNSGNGWQTKFTDLLGYYNHDEFVNLEYINAPGPLLESDFPNDKTGSFQVGTNPNAVYGYYLLGHHYYYGEPKVFGVFRVSDVYYDSNLGLNVVRIEIKVNRKGNNFFLLN